MIAYDIFAALIAGFAGVVAMTLLMHLSTAMERFDCSRQGCSRRITVR